MRIFANIVKAGLIAGTLDIIAACTYYTIRTGKNPDGVLKFVASGVFGKEAFSGGIRMSILGLIFHFCIAFAFTIFLFWIFPKISFFTNNKILSGILYGIFMWAVMQFLVVPLSNTPKSPLILSNAIIAAMILIICIGIPLTLIAAKTYKYQ